MGAHARRSGRLARANRDRGKCRRNASRQLRVRPCDKYLGDSTRSAIFGTDSARRGAGHDREVGAAVAFGVRWLASALKGGGKPPHSEGNQRLLTYDRLHRMGSPVYPVNLGGAASIDI